MVRERYKDTELGKIPEDWGINSIFTTIVPTVQINPLNSPNKKIKYIDISSISRDLLKIINYTEFLGRDAPSRARKQVNENDIIFSTVRPYLKQISIVQPTLKNEDNVSVFSEEFLNDLLKYKNQNVAIAAINRLLNDEIRARTRKNATESRKFSEMLQNTINKYNNRKVTTQEILKELSDLAREIREAKQRGEKLGLSEAELAFYDALGVNDSAVEILGDEILKQIAQDLVKTIKKNVTIDWNSRESVRAKMRVAIKRILRKNGYPPDKQKKAIQTVMEQAELLCSVVAA